MKIFIQNTDLSAPTVKIIKEEKLSKYCWNVIVHTFKLADKKVLYTLDVYKEISDALKMSLTHPVDYEFYGNYFETCYYNLKDKQVKTMGLVVLTSLVFRKDEASRQEIIRNYSSCKNFNTDLLLRNCGWTFQIIGKNEVCKPGTEILKKVEVKFDFGPQKPTTQYMKLVDHILYSEEKRIVIVFFVDGTKIVKNCHSEDKFDIYVGVSLAITKYLFGNNTTNFIKFVNRKSKKITIKKGGK